MSPASMTAWLIAHPGPDLWLSVGLMWLFVWSAAYWLSGKARRHRQILIAWGIQTFSDPKREDDEEFAARPSARDSSHHAKTARAMR